MQQRGCLPPIKTHNCTAAFISQGQFNDGANRPERLSPILNEIVSTSVDVVCVPEPLFTCSWSRVLIIFALISERMCVQILRDQSALSEMRAW